VAASATAPQTEDEDSEAGHGMRGDPL